MTGMSALYVYDNARRLSDPVEAVAIMEALDAAGDLAGDMHSFDPDELRERYAVLGELFNSTMVDQRLHQWAADRAAITLTRLLAQYRYKHTQRTVYRWLSGRDSWIQIESNAIYATAAAQLPHISHTVR
jgi:hypothetical protein